MLNTIWISYMCFPSSLKVNNLSPFGLINFLLNKRSFNVVAFPPVWSLLEAIHTSTLLFVGYLRRGPFRAKQRDEKVRMTFSSLCFALKAVVFCHWAI